MSDIKIRVKDIISETLGVEIAKVTDDAKFVEDLGADSLDQVELIMALEAAFDQVIPDEDADKILTVSNAIQYIIKKSEVSEEL